MTRLLGPRIRLLTIFLCDLQPLKCEATAVSKFLHKQAAAGFFSHIMVSRCKWKYVSDTQHFPSD